MIREAAHVFQRDHGGADNWGEVGNLTASDAAAGDLVGIRATISGDTTFFTTMFKVAPGGGKGAVYVFDLLQLEPTVTATPTTTSTATITPTPTPCRQIQEGNRV